MSRAGILTTCARATVSCNACLNTSTPQAKFVCSIIQHVAALIAIPCSGSSANIDLYFPADETWCTSSFGLWLSASSLATPLNCSNNPASFLEPTSTPSPTPGITCPGPSYLCPPGSFSPNPFHPFCTPCPKGQFNDAFGKTSCRYCTCGFFSNEEGSKSCKKCQRGRFSNFPFQSCY